MHPRVAALIVAGLLALPASAAGQGTQAPEYTAAEATTELREAIASLSGENPALDPTVELRDLALALPSLDRAQRRQARSMLARPPANDDDVEPFGGEWHPSAVDTVAESEHFLVHYPVVPGCAAPTQDCDEPSFANPGGGPHPDYVDEVIDHAEASFEVQNTDLGWPLPKPDDPPMGPPLGGDAKVDIYLADLCDETGGPCVFGYAWTEDNTDSCNSPPFKCWGFLVLDNDYNFDEFGYVDPTVPLQVTTAHEYNHVLQFNLDFRQDDWMFESTAVWVEEHVFPDADDWVVTYMGPWARGSTQPITDADAGGGLRIYGSAVWNHWLEERFGADSILDSWQASRQVEPKDNGVASYNEGIRQNGGDGFSQEFARFAAATSEWRTGDGGFPDSGHPDFDDVERKGRLVRGADPKPVVLDHTAYRLLNVDRRGVNRLKLRARAPRGVRTGIALVGRNGGQTGGTVVRRVDFLPTGGRGSVRLGHARTFERITAVVVNADGRTRNGNYTRDDERFTLKVR